MGWKDTGQLECGHCKCKFEATLRQKKSYKYEKRSIFCSAICRKAANPLRKPKPNFGPCPTCGQMFVSRAKKTFCSLKCYNKSPQFLALVDSLKQKGHAFKFTSGGGRPSKETRACLHCGTEFLVQPARTKRYCNQICYRSYLAERFDRRIANPETLALPQNYDEFLVQDELGCLIEGCNWYGLNLSLHMNFAHGVRSDDFKRAAGFNLNTGVIAAPLHLALKERKKTGVAVFPGRIPELTTGRVYDYQSLEGKEHQRKARMLCLAREGPLRVCEYCSKEYRQSTIFSRSKYCSKQCQSRAMYRKFADRSGRKRRIINASIAKEGS
jgi:hypothetical protein